MSQPDEAPRVAFARIARRRARVPHTCCECGRTIEAGSVYFDHAQRDSVRGFTHGSVCVPCFWHDVCGEPTSRIEEGPDDEERFPWLGDDDLPAAGWATA